MHRARLLLWTRLSIVLVPAMAIGVIASCTMTNEPTGIDVSLEHRGVNHCIKRCAKSHQDQMQDEAERHQRRMKACRRESDSAQSECRQGEIERHQAAIEEIKASKNDCMNNCHRQGGGHGGDD